MRVRENLYKIIGAETREKSIDVYKKGRPNDAAWRNYFL